MSPVQNVWRQLVQRRLWPVAIVLVAALAAVPVMLAKDPEPIPAPPAPAADTSKGELASEPIVALASTEDGAKRRKVLGTPKNPFRPAKAKKADDGAAGSGGGGDATGGSPAESAPPATGGGDTPDAGSAPSPAAPVEPVEPAPAPKTYEPGELTVRFGGDESLERQSVKRGEPLPSAEEPLLIYTGLRKDGKTAVFLLDAGVVAVGDGECNPSPEQCEEIYLRAGETMFLDVASETGAAGQQFQLDLIKIHKASGSKGSTASRTMSAGTKSGGRRSELRSEAGRVSAYLP